MSDRDDRYEWIPLKSFAAARGKSVRTVRRWIHAGKLEAKRDGPMDESPWLVKVVSQVSAKAS